MTSSLEIDGTELQNIRTAAERTGYSRDYITRLAREQKITASQIGRQWFVDVDSLQAYATAVATEQSLRHQQLSEERRQERLASQKVTPAPKQKHSTKLVTTLRAQTLAVAVLCLGLGLGVVLNQLPLSAGFSTQVANTSLFQSTQGHAAVIDSVEPVTASGVQFSHESVGLSTMEGATKGILLLPEVASTTQNPAELFSDEVKVVVDEKGNQYVARVDEYGQVVEKIPFVVVPVTSSQTP
jgi:excisionase family DNA binding protein